MKKVITYGTFDLLHQGHLNLLRRAKELGDYLIVGVTNDNFDRDRGKLNVRNNVLERVEAVKATGYADKIIIEDYVGQKIDDIQKHAADLFAIGSDCGYRRLFRPLVFPGLSIQQYELLSSDRISVSVC